MTIDPATFLAILAMAIATYATRLSGFIIGPFLPEEGRLRQALDAVPAAVLTAVVAPTIVSGPAELIASIATIIAITDCP